MTKQTDRGYGRIIIWGYVVGPCALRRVCHAPKTYKFSRFVISLVERGVETKLAFLNLILHIYFQEKNMNIPKLTLKHSMKFAQTNGIGIREL